MSVPHVSFLKLLNRIWLKFGIRVLATLKLSAKFNFFRNDLI